MKQSIPQSTLWIYITVVLLPFNGGYINAATLVSYLHNSVGYVTGNIAFAGAFLVAKEYHLFLTMLLLIFCFILGAFVTGLIIKSEYYHKDYRYGLNLMIQAVLVCISMVLMQRGYAYSEYFLATTMGLQNAMTTHYSSALIRTTHMTGTVTDLGVLIAHAVKGTILRPWLILLYLILIVSFFIGAITGAYMFFNFQAHGLLVPIGIYFMMIILHKIQNIKNRTNKILP